MRALSRSRWLWVRFRPVRIQRARLRKWLELEEHRAQVTKAAAERQGDALWRGLASYLAAAVSCRVRWENVPWQQAVLAYEAAVVANVPDTLFPMLLHSPDKKGGVDFDYDGRMWYLWSHLLARHYGWTLEYIANLDIDEAIGHIQEILVDEQLEREWEWATSEVAYSYNQATKHSELRPLPRPAWMKMRKIEPPKKIRIHKMFVPMGNVVSQESQTSQSA